MLSPPFLPRHESPEDGTRLVQRLLVACQIMHTAPSYRLVSTER